MRSHTKIYLLHWICYDRRFEINSVNPICLIFSKVSRYCEKISKNKYLMLVPTNESKETIIIIIIIIKNEELWVIAYV